MSKQADFDQSPKSMAFIITDLILFSTVDVSSPRMHLFEKLIASVADNMTTLPSVSVKMWVLLQNCDETRAISLAARLPSFVRSLSAEALVPLSAARNILIRAQIRSGGFSPAAIVAFPDDDAWYPSGFLPGLVGLFETRADLDFWFCRYGTSPGSLQAASASVLKASRQTVIRKSSSNTIFVRGNIVTDVGYFDEKLGLGTSIGSAEDIDYALRVFHRANLTCCYDEIMVGHRDKMPGLRGKYYSGGLIVLARYARRDGLREFARKLFIGVYLLVNGELALRTYFSAVGTAFIELLLGTSSRWQLNEDEQQVLNPK